jgi:hypothetical protein
MGGERHKSCQIRDETASFPRDVQTIPLVRTVAHSKAKCTRVAYVSQRETRRKDKGTNRGRRQQTKRLHIQGRRLIANGGDRGGTFNKHHQCSTQQPQQPQKSVIRQTIIYFLWDGAIFPAWPVARASAVERELEVRILFPKFHSEPAAACGRSK